ncbi:MAG: hypothetical protein WB770_05050 [Acidimicrobiales bacterium]
MARLDLATRPSVAPPRGLRVRAHPVLSVLLVVTALGLFASPVFAAAKTKTVSFSGHYSGTASLLIENGSVTISSVKGSGTGTPSVIGASKISGHGSGAASALCDPFGGTGAMTGAKAKMTFTVTRSSAKGCSSGQSGPVTVTFNGTGKVTGGTGTAAGASGTLHFSGSMTLGGTSGSQSGSFRATVSGKLTIK